MTRYLIVACAAVTACKDVKQATPPPPAACVLDPRTVIESACGGGDKWANCEDSYPAYAEPMCQRYCDSLAQSATCQVATNCVDQCTQQLLSQDPQRTEQVVTAALKRWLIAQNKGNFEAYSEMYFAAFAGTKKTETSTEKMDRQQWLADRERMFEKPMKVEATETTIAISGSTMEVKCQQRWASGNYADVGTKVLAFASSDDGLSIASEEMLDSTRVPAPSWGRTAKDGLPHQLAGLWRGPHHDGLTEAWIKKVVAKQREGKILVQGWLGAPSLGWGCICPDWFLGVYPGGGPGLQFVHLDDASVSLAKQKLYGSDGMPKRMGDTTWVEGYFTGANKKFDDEEYQHLFEFHITRFLSPPVGGWPASSSELEPKNYFYTDKYVEPPHTPDEVM